MYKLFVLDQNIWNHTNIDRWKDRIGGGYDGTLKLLKHLEINQILALNNS